MDVMEIITVKVDKELKKKMKEIDINWSEYIRESIRKRIELEERKKAAKKIIDDLRSGKHTVPEGFLNKTVRETRENR